MVLRTPRKRSLYVVLAEGGRTGRPPLVVLAESHRTIAELYPVQVAGVVVPGPPVFAAGRDGGVESAR